MDPDADLDLEHWYIYIILQRWSHKTVEIEVFLTNFAWWWKDPDPYPYLWRIRMLPRAAQKLTDERCHFSFIDWQWDIYYQRPMYYSFINYFLLFILLLCIYSSSHSFIHLFAVHAFFSWLLVNCSGQIYPTKILIWQYTDTGSAALA